MSVLYAPPFPPVSVPVKEWMSIIVRPFSTFWKHDQFFFCSFDSGLSSPHSLVLQMY